MTELQPYCPKKTIVLVGLMGAGKTCIGNLLADHLKLVFVDADAEIEKAAGCSISEIFELFGEKEFREGERRVIKRILQEPVQVLATGGGAFMDIETRKAIKKCGVSIWLRADLDILAARTARRGHRPLLNGKNHRATLKKLIDQRSPIYQKADLTVESGNETPAITVNKILKALADLESNPSHYGQS